jgi:hypothetical protein
MRPHSFNSLRCGRDLQASSPNREAAAPGPLLAIVVRSSATSVKVDQDGSFFTGLASPSA